MTVRLEESRVRNFRQRWLAACLAVLWLTAPPLPAADLTWDPGNTSNGVAINPANGNWNTTSTNKPWNNAGTNVAWSSANSAVFGGSDGTYSVTVDASLSAEDLWFKNSGYTFSATAGRTLGLTRTNGSTKPQLRVAGGKTVSIGNNIIVQNGVSTGFYIGENGGTSAGTLNITNGGTLRQNSSNTGGIDGSGTVVNIQTGGTWSGPNNSGSSGSIGIGMSAGSSATVNVSGGSIFFGSGKQPLNVGSSGTGTLNLTSGTLSLNAASTNALQLAAGASGAGTVNLNGGTLATPRVGKGSGTSAIFNFNGGKLQANADNVGFMAGLSRANVRNGAAVIDTGAFSITIAQPLLHSDIPGDNATDGGLSKLGTGTLALTGANTYTGTTVVNAGTLALSGAIRGPVQIGAAGVLTRHGVIGPISITNSLALSGTFRIRADKSSGIVNDTVEGVTQLTCGGTLILELTGGPPAAGEVYTVFKAASYTGSFSSIQIVPPPTNGSTVDGSRLAIDGTLRVMANTSPPSFVGQLATTASEVFEGGAVTLSASVTGGFPLTYQWRFKDTPIPGATGPTLTLNNLTPLNSGDYTLTVTNPYGTVTSGIPVSLAVVGTHPETELSADGMWLLHDTMPWFHYRLLKSTSLDTWSYQGPVVMGNGSQAARLLPWTGESKQFAIMEATPGVIAPSRLPAEPWKDTQWNDPGGWTTINVTTLGLLPNTPAVNAATKIAQIIQSTSGRRRLYFPAGTYYFNSSLAISQSDIWLDGAGHDQTIFRIDSPNSLDSEIRFSGSTGGALSVVGPVVAGEKVITLANASSIAVGDIIQLYADNAPLTNGGQAWSLQIYSQNFKVLRKSGNTLLLDMKVLLDYPESNVPVVRRFSAIRNVKVSHLKIDRIYESATENVANLEFFYAYNCLVTGVESNFSGRTHIGFENSKDCVITGNFVHDCWKHTTGGYGYGYNLVATTGCRISNNKSARLRHQIILSIGANHNVVSYNSVEETYDYNDIALHSVFAYMNLFEGNMFKEGYADSSKDGWSEIEATTGPGNTWFRNYATGQVGSLQNGTDRQVMIGNRVGAIRGSGADHYFGANNSNGTATWGVFTSSTLLPASLYLMEKPDFFDGATPWPMFGPDVSPNWGIANKLPARLANPAGP